MNLLLIMLLVCGVHGDAKTKMAYNLNVLKNRASPPGKQVAHLSGGLDEMLVHGNDLKRFDNNASATIQGYVVEVKDGGLESCNCHSATNKDTHIALAKIANAPKNQRVIVEVTPKFRAIHPDWTTAKLKPLLLGHLVKVTGWLMADVEHVNNAENTHPGYKLNWRATVWEIHPVTAIEVLK